MRFLRSLGPYLLSLLVHVVVGGSIAAGTLFVVQKVMTPDPVPVELVVTRPPQPAEQPEEPAPREPQSVRRVERLAPPPPPVRRRRVKMLAEIPQVSAPDTRLDRLAMAPVLEPVPGPAPIDVPVREGPPAPPVYGVQMDSLSAGGGTLGVPVGNTLATSPENRGPVLDPAGRPERGLGTGLRPIEEHKISVWPERVDGLVFRYPEEARRAGKEGSVLLRLKIDERGHVRQAELVRPEDPILDAEALANAKRLRFSPALAGKRAVACEIRYTFTFILD